MKEPTEKPIYIEIMILDTGISLVLARIRKYLVFSTCITFGILKLGKGKQGALNIPEMG